MRLINNSFILLTCFLTMFILTSLLKINDTLVLNTQNVDFDMNMGYVALTFDDGPNRKTTEKLLDGLKERGAKVTFFVLGEKAEIYPDLIKRIVDEGHQIGNHTYNHRNLRGLDDEEISYQVETTNDIVKDIIGEEPKLLRPSYGLYNEKVKNINKLPIILWSIDTEDWKIKKAKRLYEKNVEKIKDGDIILMHDIFQSSVDASLMIIDDLTERGFEFLTIEELANEKGIPLIENEVYFDFHEVDE